MSVKLSVNTYFTFLLMIIRTAAVHRCFFIFSIRSFQQCKMDQKSATWTDLLHILNMFKWVSRDEPLSHATCLN